MGASRDDFVKYPRTPHLFGSRGTDDDKHLSPDESADFIADPALRGPVARFLEQERQRVQGEMEWLEEEFSPFRQG